MIIGEIDEDNIPLLFTFDEDVIEEVTNQMVALIQLKTQIQYGGQE